MDHVVGVDLGGTKILTAMADQTGEILTRVKVATQAPAGVRAVIDRVEDTVRQAAQGADLTAVAVGCPGPLDHVTGTVFQAPNLGWRDVPLGPVLTERLGVPVFVENDANLAALGEHTRGAGRNVDNMVYVTVSTGVGGGLILDRRIYHGEGGGAGEIGHMTLEPDGPPCNCGRRGCLEALASGTAIARRARELLARGEGGWLGETAGGEVTAETVARAAGRGDPAAAALLREAAVYLGWGLANVITLLFPRLVVIGGGVTKSGPEFLAAAREAAAGRAYGPARERAEVVPALLGGESGLYGAVALALNGPG